MKEHALPQDIVGYRFHIIGNMTLKQFAEVAAGCVVGFLIYTTNLPSILKWSMILIAAGIGAAMAFVPIEERPLDQWFVALFNALYRPTKFFWKRTPKIPDAFLYTPKTENQNQMKDVDLSPARRARVKEYLRSIDDTGEMDELEKYSTQRLNEVMDIFNTEYHAPVVAVAETIPIIETQPTQIQTQVSTPEPTPAPIPTTISEQLPDVTVHTGNTTASATDNQAMLDSVQKLIQQESVKIKTSAPVPAESTISMDFSVPHIASETITTPSANVSPTQVAPTPQATSTVVSVPEMQSISVEHTQMSDVQNAAQEQLPTKLSDTSPAPANVYVDETFNAQISQSQSQAQATTPLQQALQNSALPFPAKPTEPNKLVGMVLDPQSNPITGAIVEIITPDGMSARAVKTNIVGQFFITTPLNNGRYSIVIDKEGFQFPPQEITINGSIIEPIEIRSN